MTDPNSGEGWYAWQHMPSNTSHIAYVHENGEVYLPESPGDTDEPFLLAAAAGHVHRLVRADDADALAEALSDLMEYEPSDPSSGGTT